MTRTLHIVACLILLSTFLPMAVSAQTRGLSGTVTKQGAGNPSLGIITFDGPPEARNALESVLKRCDWFKVVADANASRATVQLAVSCQMQPKPVFTIRVTPAGKAPFQVTGSGDGVATAAGAATDAVLKALFRVPALCNCPIAYALQGTNNLKELFTCTLAGGKTERLTNNNAISTEPSWGHSGALVYTLAKGNSLSAVLIDVANSRQRIVSRAKGLNSSAALSRDGRYVAIPLSLGQQVDLYIIDLKDGSRRRLTQDKDVESSPVFSPDGKRICFVSDRSGRPQLYMMDVAGGKPTRLQLGGGECVSPDWSPVSNKLCFAQRVASGRYAVAVLDLGKADAQPEIVTDAAGNWEAPSWGPDGRHIACTRQSGKNQDLYIVDSWYHSIQQLTKGSKVSLPAWAPAK